MDNSQFHKILETYNLKLKKYKKIKRKLCNDEAKKIFLYNLKENSVFSDIRKRLHIV